MLSNPSSQYLHPDYLPPLPTTLDAKKSPLALLAQTCNAIGKDTAPSKTIIPPIRKENKEKGGKNSENGDKKSELKEKPLASPSDVKNVTKDSGKDELIAASSPRKVTSSPEVESCKPMTSSATPSPSRNSPLSESKDAKLKPDSVMPISATSSILSSTAGHSINSNSVGFSHPLLPTASLPADLASSHHLYHSSLLASSAHSALDSAKLNPYVGYTRVKTAAGSSMLVPVCRDPYCSSCQAAARAGGATACNAGCTQCTHDKALSSTAAATAALHSHHPLYPHHLLPSLPTAADLHSLSALYPPSLGLQQPYVCNWMNGHEYCGKRFLTSEELLTHLRTHTTATDSASLSSLAAAYPHLGLGAHLPDPYSVLLPSATAALRPPYPKSLSPSSILASGRYHPYKPPTAAAATPGLAAPLLPAAAALPYPYSLYSQRLGAS